MSESAVVAMKREIVRAAHRAGEGHIASAFSILDILWVLYDRVLRIANPAAPDDRFVLSKGHASLALYAVLAAKGILAADALEHFCGYQAALGGHPDSVKLAGVEASTGSLGHGLPIATGMALGAKIQKHGNQIYCLVGDGECNEGSVWESALLASHHQLHNLTCIVDYNHSTDRALQMGDLAAKFRSFGWDTAAIDGHHHGQILQALKQDHPERPLAVIAQTTKGKGVSLMENEPAWHHRSPNPDELQAMLKELA